MLCRVGQVLFALLATQSANAESLRIADDGVNLEVITTSEKVILCINSRHNTNISGQYGVSIEAPGRDIGVWQDRLPERIVSEDWDFKLPLAIALRTKGNAVGQKLRLKLGACSDQCKLVIIDFSVPTTSPAELSRLGCGQG
jgi:hypothetical protein